MFCALLRPKIKANKNIQQNEMLLCSQFNFPLSVNQESRCNNIKNNHIFENLFYELNIKFHGIFLAASNIMTSRPYV